MRGRTQPRAELHLRGETVKRAWVRNRNYPANCICFCEWACGQLCVCVCVCVCIHTEAFSTLRKTPVDSTTYFAPASPQGISAGFILERVKEQSQSKM